LIFIEIFFTLFPQALASSQNSQKLEKGCVPLSLKTDFFIGWPEITLKTLAHVIVITRDEIFLSVHPPSNLNCLIHPLTPTGFFFRVGKNPFFVGHWLFW